MTVLTMEYGTTTCIAMPNVLPSVNRSGSPLQSRTAPDPSITRCILGSANTVKICSGSALMIRVTDSISGLWVTKLNVPLKSTGSRPLAWFGVGVVEPGFSRRSVLVNGESVNVLHLAIPGRVHNESLSTISRRILPIAFIPPSALSGVLSSDQFQLAITA